MAKDADDREEFDRENAARGVANHEDDLPSLQEPASPATSPDDAAGQGDGEASAPPPYVTDPRLDMAREFSAKRRQKRDAEAEADDDEPVSIVPKSDQYGKPVESRPPGADDEDSGDEAADHPAAKAAEPAKAAKAGDDELVELQVDGNRISLPRSEVIALAQKNIAADSRLEAARRILQDAERHRSNVMRDEHHVEDDDERRYDALEDRPDAGRGRNTIDLEQVRQTVDTIQAGSPEEGAEALADLLATARQGLTPEDLHAAVGAELRQRDQQSRINSAMTDLRSEYPEIAGDDGLGLMVINDTVNGMVSAMQQAGIPDEYLNQVRGNPKAVRDYYMQLLDDPNWKGPLPQPIDVAREAAKRVNDRYVRDNRGFSRPSNQRAGQVEVSETRRARKAGLSNQPRSGSVRSAPGAPTLSIAEQRRRRFSRIAEDRAPA